MSSSHIQFYLNYVIGARLSKPHTSKNFCWIILLRVWMTENKHQTLQVLVQHKGSLYPPYMVIWLSILRKVCNKVFLNGHIWSLDCQYCGSMWQSFTEWPSSLNDKLRQISWKYCYENSLTSDRLQGNMHNVDSAKDR